MRDYFWISFLLLNVLLGVLLVIAVVSGEVESLTKPLYDFTGGNTWFMIFIGLAPIVINAIISLFIDILLRRRDERRRDERRREKMRIANFHRKYNLTKNFADLLHKFKELSEEEKKNFKQDYLEYLKGDKIEQIETLFGFYKDKRQYSENPERTQFIIDVENEHFERNIL